MNENLIQDRLKVFKEKFDSDDFFEVVLNEKENIVAFHVVKKGDYLVNLKAGHIYTIWVSPEYRGRGIAKTLKEMAEAWGRKNGLHCLLTSVNRNNIKMISLNENLGYETFVYKMKKKL